MNWQEFKDEYGEGPEDHFEDAYEYARYLDRTGQKHKANLVRRNMEGEESEEEGKD